MDLQSLLYFKKIAELEHFTKAANELHIAQPSLSRTINNLENELGVAVFDRVGKYIKLNTYGKILLERTNRVFKELDGITTDIEESKKDFDTTVIISLSSASKILPEIIMEFNKIYPTTKFKILHGDYKTASNAAHDLFLYSTAHPIFDHPCACSLFREEILVALPKSNPLSDQEAINLHDLSELDFICLQKGKSIRTITDFYCEMVNFKPKIILESNSPETVKNFIEKGLGVSFTPSITWGKVLGGDNISLLPVAFPRCYSYLNLTWREDDYLSSSAKNFRDYLIRYFETSDNYEPCF
ncbi:LysR family transcriptional regulator [Lacrimispora indolis]|uniref:LysR family transcriptional regulator n=1 Tax=Lacrimispora indolis TaxID=69825 RepID=UPI00041FD990|nr:MULTISPECIES: LysR family transcriptional regulator [Lachnospiraceae]MBE7721818.1 LysR family transcriptional regulator [Lacrimispora celerecrescens]